MRVAAIIVIVLLLVGILAGCGNPEVKIVNLEGKNGSNTVYEIKIDPHARCPKGTFAQEFWESRAKRDPVTWLSIRNDSSAHREFEIMGHEIETQAAVEFCGENETQYRRDEALIMYRGYDGLFKDSSPDAIEKRMRKQTKEAREWVEDNHARIAALKV